jgi:hypothetical protein
VLKRAPRLSSDVIALRTAARWRSSHICQVSDKPAFVPCALRRMSVTSQERSLSRRMIWDPIRSCCTGSVSSSTCSTLRSALAPTSSARAATRAAFPEK